MLASMRLPIAIALSAVLVPLGLAQSGRWEGAITGDRHEVKIQVDLFQDAKGAWKGAITLPGQNVNGFPLSEITVSNGDVRFVMQGAPGRPVFGGKLAPDGKSITGRYMEAGKPASFHLTRTGDAKLEKAGKSTPVAKELEGAWEGTLDTGGAKLRLVLKLANGPDGATGTLTSVDQGGAVIPIATITQEGSSLQLELPSIGGSYAGEIGKDGITGKWKQGMGELPLTFTRAAAK
jgi:hypothetical protein